MEYRLGINFLIKYSPSPINYDCKQYFMLINKIVPLIKQLSCIIAYTPRVMLVEEAFVVI